MLKLSVKALTDSFESYLLKLIVLKQPPSMNPIIVHRK